MQHNPPPPWPTWSPHADVHDGVRWSPGQEWNDTVTSWTNKILRTPHSSLGGGYMDINWNSPIYVFVLRCWSLIVLILYLQAASRCLETLLPAEVANYHFTVIFVQWTQDEHCPSYIAPAYMWYPSLTPRRFPPPVPQATVGDMGMRLSLYMRCMQVGNSSAMKCYPLAM